MESNAMKVCLNCSTIYDWRKSKSVLRMSYCNILCENRGLGFSLESVLLGEVHRKVQPVSITV